MTKSSAGFFAALTAVAALLIGQMVQLASLRRELATLRSGVESPRLRAAAHPEAHPSSDAAKSPAADTSVELASLRDEIRSLRSSLEASAKVRTALPPSASIAAPTRLLPVAELRNSGLATPESAAQTLLWAAVAGDLDAIAGSLTLTPAARQKADEWFSRQSDETRRQYGNPEKLMALMLARDAGRLSGMGVLGQDTLGSDDTILRLRFASEDGKTKDDTLPFHRSAAGWQLQLSERAVERLARQLGGGG